MEEMQQKICADALSKRQGIYTARDEYFYRHGKTEQDLVNKIKAVFPNANIIEAGDHWAPFRGGASVARSSHWFVKFTISEVN